GRLDENRQVGARLLLADELAEPLWAQRGLGRVLVAALRRDQAAGRGAHGVTVLVGCRSTAHSNALAIKPQPTAAPRGRTKIPATMPGCGAGIHIGFASTRTAMTAVAKLTSSTRINHDTRRRA